MIAFPLKRSLQLGVIALGKMLFGECGGRLKINETAASRKKTTIYRTLQ